MLIIAESLRGCSRAPPAKSQPLTSTATSVAVLFMIGSRRDNQRNIAVDWI
jgi:hypothetical protein